MRPEIKAPSCSDVCVSPARPSVWGGDQLGSIEPSPAGRFNLCVCLALCQTGLWDCSMCLVNILCIYACCQQQPCQRVKKKKKCQQIHLDSFCSQVMYPPLSPPSPLLHFPLPPPSLPPWCLHMRTVWNLDAPTSVIWLWQRSKNVKKWYADRGEEGEGKKTRGEQQSGEAALMFFPLAFSGESALPPLFSFFWKRIWGGYSLDSVECF